MNLGGVDFSDFFTLHYSVVHCYSTLTAWTTILDLYILKFSLFFFKLLFCLHIHVDFFFYWNTVIRDLYILVKVIAIYLLQLSEKKKKNTFLQANSKELLTNFMVFFCINVRLTSHVFMFIFFHPYFR